MSDDEADVRRRFRDAVNMTAGQLEHWLATDESRSVGATPSGERKTASSGGSESVGHASGRHIVRILHTRADHLTDADYAHMRTVSAFVDRHLAQRPEQEELEDSRWRYSLMNWGHDPLAR
jgi:Protein of unknown function (DUF3140)